MRRFFAILLFAACLSCVARSTVVAEQESPVERTIEGKWRLAATTWYGKDSDNEIGVIWEFQGKGLFTMHFPGGRKLEGRYQIDTKNKPWHIDVQTKEDEPELGGGGSRKGIVSIDRDRLQLCVTGSSAAPRPTGMVSKTGTLNILRILKRVKKEQ